LLGSSFVCWASLDSSGDLSLFLILPSLSVNCYNIVTLFLHYSLLHSRITGYGGIFITVATSSTSSELGLGGLLRSGWWPTPICYRHHTTHLHISPIMMEPSMAHMVLPRQDEGKSGADTLVELLSKGFGSQVRRHGIAVQSYAISTLTSATDL